jgi:hypothetical protein
MRMRILLCFLGLALGSGCSEGADENKVKSRSLSTYINTDRDAAAATPTAFGKLARRWDCAGLKQTFRPNADLQRAEIQFEYADGTTGIETGVISREGELITIELQMFEEITLYSYDSSRDTMAWRDINGDSHVCLPL